MLVNTEFGILLNTPLSSLIVVVLRRIISTVPLISFISRVSPTLTLPPIISNIPEMKFEIKSLAARLTAIPTIPKLNNVPAKFTSNNCNITIKAMKYII